MNWKILLLFIFLINNSYALDQLNGSILAGYTGEPFHASFEPGPCNISCWHEFQFISVDRPQDIIAGTLLDDRKTGPCNDNPAIIFEINLPRSGLWTLQVRTCIEGGCSAWARSTDITSEQIKCRPGPWYLYQHIAPPGGINFDEPITIRGSIN